MYGVIGSKTRKLAKLYGAISSKTRAISKVYAVVGGVTRLVYQSKGKPRFVHVSFNRVNYSDDLGATWTAVDCDISAGYSGASGRYRSVLFHDNILLVSFMSYLYKSTDYGITWTKARQFSAYTSNYHRTELAYCEATGYYLALEVVPNNKYWAMWSSTDASNWTVISSSYDDFDGTAGTAGNSIYVHHCILKDGKILFSFNYTSYGYLHFICDGINCTKMFSNLDSAYLPFTYYNGNYFGVKYNDTLVYSPDWTTWSSNNYTYVNIQSGGLSSPMIFGATMNTKMAKVSDSIFSFGCRGENWVYSGSSYPCAIDINLDSFAKTNYTMPGYFKSFGYISYDGTRYLILDNISAASAVNTRYVFKQSGTTFTQIGSFPISYNAGNAYTPSMEQTVVVEVK